MDLGEIRAFIAAFGASGLAEMEFTRGEWTLRLARSAEGPVPVRHDRGAARPPQRPVPAGARPVEAGVRAPLSGLVFLAPSPDAAEFVTVGSRVAAGDVVAVIEAMKMFNEIRAERDGTVEAVLVDSAEEVEAGQLLMRIG